MDPAPLAVEPRDERPEPSTPGPAPYVAPLLVFLALSYLEWIFRGPWYPAWYAVKIGLTALVAWMNRAAWRDIRWEPRWIVPGILAGIAGFVVWVGLDVWPGYPHFGGGRVEYNPLEAIRHPVHLAGFLAMRFFGLVIVVPVIEELFWRSLILRTLIKAERFEEVPIGHVPLVPGLLSIAGFTILHPEWLAAVAWGTMVTLVLARSRSLFACVVMHAATNLCLGIYVLATGSWQYW